jgi:nonsense-mediated mRNA decay protein 3
MSLCPKCGKESRGICLDCFLEDNPLVMEEPKLISCSCGRVRYRDRWDTRWEDVARNVAGKLKTPFELHITKVRATPVIGAENVTFNLEVTGDYKGEPFKRMIELIARPQKTTCPECSRRSGGYFEAVMQVRCDLPVKIEEGQVVKVEKVKGGIDYYVLSNNYARSLASQLRKKGFDVTTSVKTFSRRDGREIYRVYYSLKKGQGYH